MNKVEVLKLEKDGLDVREDIDRFAKTGWESIEDADIQRLKWMGLFLRSPTPGHFMVRVRIPGGSATSAQLRTLAEVSSSFGNGVIDVTTRQQIQLRHLTIEDVPEVFKRLDEVGLWSLQTGMDNVRNIMTCPATGLTSSELIDTAPLVRSLTEEIVGNRAYSNLPRKFNMAITGCLENCLHLETQDLAFVPATVQDKGGMTTGFNVFVGGKLGSGGYRIASSLDMFVKPSEVLRVTCAILEIYRDHGFRESRNTARLAFLVDRWGEERFRIEVENRLGRPYAHAGNDARKKSVNDHMGVFRQKSLGLNYIGLKIPVGRINAGDLLKIAQLSETYGTGELRLAHNQAIVIPNVADRKIGDLTEEPLLQRYVYNPTPIQKGLVSCVGNDYCNLAVIETKSRAIETAKKIEAKLGTDLKPITMHWSGCPASCGNHLVADVGLIGKKVKVKGEIIEAVDIYVGGRSGPDPKPSTKLLEDVPCDVLPDVLSGILPYHARHKMHQSKLRVPKASGKSELVKCHQNHSSQSTVLCK
ncbi:MAG: ferredoxin--nitrite reductase [Nitrospirales bacterium]|nr:MAG: ferredoxin--nitrite reductase [Nitrospirales bacterium]